MIYFGNRPVLGFALGDDLSFFQQCFAKALNALKSFEGSLTAREKTVLALGLAASHLEESLVHGDWKRAEAHAENVMKLLVQLQARP